MRIIVTASIAAVAIGLAGCETAPAPATRAEANAGLAMSTPAGAACGTYVAGRRALKGREDEVFCSEECRRSNPHP